MGLDVTIYFRAKPGIEIQPEDWLPEGYKIEPLPDYEAEFYPEATHELNTLDRFYGDGYERGPWPYTAAALMILFATVGVERVWFGSDAEEPREIRPEDVLKISSHYMANGHRPYRQARELT